MKSSLTRSINSINSFPFILKLNTTDATGTPIMYANPVNHMPRHWLTHPPNQPLYRYWRGEIKYLHDPNAEDRWYDKVLDAGRRIADSVKGMLRREVIKLYGITPVSDAIYQTLIRGLKFI